MSVSKVAARVKLFLYITTPLLLLIAEIWLHRPDARLEAKNAKGGNLNRNCFQQYHVFPKLGKPR